MVSVIKSVLCYERHHFVNKWEYVDDVHTDFVSDKGIFELTNKKTVFRI